MADKNVENLYDVCGFSVFTLCRKERHGRGFFGTFSIHDDTVKRQETVISIRGTAEILLMCVVVNMGDLRYDYSS